MRVKQKQPRPRTLYKSPKRAARELRKAVRAGCIVAAASVPLFALSDDRPNPLPAIDAMGLILASSAGAQEETGYTPTHYVTADASGSGDGSEGSPWTMAQAQSSAVGGNQVQVGPGVFTGTNTSDRWAPAWEPTNSGTSGNEIVFFAEYPAVANASNRSELRSGSTTMGSGCPAFGCDGVNYIIWDGFYVNETNSATRSDTGPVVLHSTTGSEIRRCLIQGTTATWSDNHNGVRLEHTTDCKVLDCELTGFFCTGTNLWNEASILLYASVNYEIAYNLIHGNKTGIYFKGAQGGTFLRTPGSCHHNKIHDNEDGSGNGGGIRIGGVNRNTGFLDIYQNLIYGHDGANGQDIAWQTWADPAPLDVRVVNNTLASTGDGNSYWPSDSPSASCYNGCVFQNNIVNDRHVGDEALGTQFDQLDTMDYNSYTNSTVFNSNSWTDWGNEGLDANGRQGSAGFEDAGSNDYRLASGSGCLNAGQDILNLLGGGTSASINQGCYITADMSDQIGVRSNPSY